MIFKIFRSNSLLKSIFLSWHNHLKEGQESVEYKSYAIRIYMNSNEDKLQQVRDVFLRVIAEYV